MAVVPLANSRVVRRVAGEMVVVPHLVLVALHRRV